MRIKLREKRRHPALVVLALAFFFCALGLCLVIGLRGTYLGYLSTVTSRTRGINGRELLSQQHQELQPWEAEGLQPEQAEGDLTPALLAAVRRDPSLHARRPDVAAAFEPAPWLLPAASRPSLPYWGLENNLDALLAARAASVREDGSSPPHGSLAVSVVLYSRSHTLLLQNWVFTAVKWAGIRNYVVAIWDDASLAACRDMNLPCLNVTAFLPPAGGGSAGAGSGGESQFLEGSFLRITWIKPRLMSALLERGYLVHLSDVDMAFPPKAFWPSMLRFLREGSADIAMERDDFGPINCGSMVVLPNPSTRAWAAAWAGHEAEALAGRQRTSGTAQQYLSVLGDRVYRHCMAPWDCQELRRQVAGSTTAVVRRYHSAWDAIYQDHCAGAAPVFLRPIDPCMPPHLHYHVVCTTGAKNKMAGLKAAGLWFLDDEATGGCLQPPPVGAVVALGEPAARRRRERAAAGGGRARGHLALQLGRPVLLRMRKLLARGDAAPVAGGTAGTAAQHGEAVASSAGVPRCQPLAWRLPQHERAFSQCDRSQLAFVHYPQI